MAEKSSRRKNRLELIESTRQKRGIGQRAASVYGWHSFRHGFVILALNAGVPVEDVRRIVGHGDAETTLDNYYNPEKKHAAERVRRQMRGTVLATGKATSLIERKAIGIQGNIAPEQLPTPSKSVADRLRELKALADEGLITKSEYATQRKTIIESI